MALWFLDNLDSLLRRHRSLKIRVYLLLHTARESAAPEWLAINSGAANRRQARQSNRRPTSWPLLCLFLFPTLSLPLLLSLELFLSSLSRVSPIIPSQFPPYSQLILTFCGNLIVLSCFLSSWLLLLLLLLPTHSPRPLAICCPLISRQLKILSTGCFLSQIFDSAIH